MILLDPALARPHPAAIAATELRKAQRDDRVPTPRSLNAFLREAQFTVHLKGMVSILLTTDAAIRTLNRDFRHKNYATDVLSFPAAEVSRGEVAGDLAISVDTARRQARDQGHSLATEIKVLILHGLLHLAGYDHEKDSGEMARRERVLRARLALPLGLIERAKTSGSAPRRGATNIAQGNAGHAPERGEGARPGAALGMLARKTSAPRRVATKRAVPARLPAGARKGGRG